MKRLVAPSDAQTFFAALTTSEQREPVLDQLERYAGWLAGPGVERGLLGPREVDRIWPRHLMNCALLEPLIPRSGSVCDLGSGAGLPGVVLAVLRPEQSVVLLEPLLRRATFLAEVASDLGLGHVSVVRARAEDYAKQRPAHRTVVARAVAPLERLARWALPLLEPAGVLLALKGETAADELAEAEPFLDRHGAADREVVTLGEGGNVTHAVRVVGPRNSPPKPATEDG